MRPAFVSCSWYDATLLRRRLHKPLLELEAVPPEEAFRAEVLSIPRCVDSCYLRSVH